MLISDEYLEINASQLTNNQLHLFIYSLVAETHHIFKNGHRDSKSLMQVSVITNRRFCYTIQEEDEPDEEEVPIEETTYSSSNNHNNYIIINNQELGMPLIESLTDAPGFEPTIVISASPAYSEPVTSTNDALVNKQDLEVLSLVEPSAEIGQTGYPGSAMIMTDFTCLVTKKGVISLMETNPELKVDANVVNNPSSIPSINTKNECNPNTDVEQESGSLYHFGSMAPSSFTWGDVKPSCPPSATRAPFVETTITKVMKTNPRPEFFYSGTKNKLISNPVIANEGDTSYRFGSEAPRAFAIETHESPSVCPSAPHCRGPDTEEQSSDDEDDLDELERYLLDEMQKTDNIYRI